MAVGSMLLVYTFVYDLTIGPMCYCIVGEMPSSKLRAKTVMLARNLYNIAGIIVAIVTPYMLNPTQWNWKAKSAFLWAGFAILSAIWVYFELPETKGRTFAELDKMFEDKVPARKFKYTTPTTFDAGEMMEKMGNLVSKVLFTILSMLRVLISKQRLERAFTIVLLFQFLIA